MQKLHKLELRDFHRGQKTDCRQYPGGFNIDDCRKPHRRKRYNGKISSKSYQPTKPMTTETPVLNEHNKAEYPPMHTGEFNTYLIVIV